MGWEATSKWRKNELFRQWFDENIHKGDVMRVFILEDDWTRVDLFQEALRGHDVEHAQSYEDAVESWDASKFDLMLLDHDLGGHQYVESDGPEKTGYSFVKHITEYPCKLPQAIVHSYNQDGAIRMVDALQKHSTIAVYQPFGITLLNTLRKFYESLPP